MSPWFGKKKKEAEQKVEEGTWEVYEATYDDAPLIIRCNSAYLTFTDKKKFGYHAGVVIALNNPHQGGLPDEKENQELLDIESGIENFLCKDGKTLFVLALTTGSGKELVFYTSEPDTCKKRLVSLQNQIPGHRLKVMVEPDEKWETYHNFIP
ncbi:MAG: DUF695 domain-containing protein [Dehalococcoidales bacterium]|nr:DUF695 domain-containing protein [Dehalococcoidales bacterium]